MTPADFIRKWERSILTERAASQSHFLDLCELLGAPKPTDIDQMGEEYCFEKGATKATGGNGFADVWRKGCFGWEYKGPHKDLEAAYRQLLNYSIALENPPLLIVSDTKQIVIRTNFTNTVGEMHVIALTDLVDGARRDLLKWAITEPERLRPKRTRDELTKLAANEFSALAQRLRDRGHEPHAVAHFVNRLVFCMFAEDVGLLPGAIFTRMVEMSAQDPAEFEPRARVLFAAMRDRGGSVGFEKVEWFNGGLFDDDSAIPLDRDDVEIVLKAAKFDWKDIDPSIFGTLFERGLDPSKRSQLGAHYTDRGKIMMIVSPVIVEPLTMEWEETKAKIADELEKEKAAKSKGAATMAHNAAVSLYNGFIERLANFRVLDPACGSGNFLNLSLNALKDIEHKASLDAEAMGLPRGFPRVGPEAVKGIEINPYAAELARVSVWIAEIQWMRRNGFDAARNPILRPLDTIECRDALIERDDSGEWHEAAWPDADVIVGNPPFLGNKKMISELGEDYVGALRRLYADTLSGGVDLVVYWFDKAWRKLESGKTRRAGLVATNSIRGGVNRDVLTPIVATGQIFEAWGDEPWIVDGAAVRVSLVCFGPQKANGARLNGKATPRILADLTTNANNTDVSAADPLAENANTASNGISKKGPFDVSGVIARDWLTAPLNPNGRSNAEVVKPWFNGLHIVRRWDDRWLINFGEMSEAEASLFEGPFHYVAQNVKPIRQLVRARNERERWWLLARRAPALQRRLASIRRAIVVPEVSKHRLVSWMPTTVIIDKNLVVVSRDDDTTFGILHSKFHEVWSLRMGTSLEDRPRYTPTTCFETFPFPEGLTPDIPAAEYENDPRAVRIAAAAAKLNELREAWLNPADLVKRVPEVVAGYPDRILPIDEKAEKILKKRTLTNLYNERPAWLDHAHAALDEAVAAAYGWGDDWKAGALTEEEILKRLFELNQQRAAREASSPLSRQRERGRG